MVDRRRWQSGGRGRGARQLRALVTAVGALGDAVARVVNGDALAGRATLELVPAALMNCNKQVCSNKG